jgi:5-methylcytosine-specific restriction endonuclease McrA
VNIFGNQREDKEMRRNYEDPVYKEARKKTLRRDKYKCQMPGCKCRKRLNVHHIFPWSTASSLRYEVSNLIVLCDLCHKSIRNIEHLYVGLFLEIVSNNSKK